MALHYVVPFRNEKDECISKQGRRPIKNVDIVSTNSRNVWTLFFLLQLEKFALHFLFRSPFFHKFDHMVKTTHLRPIKIVWNCLFLSEMNVSLWNICHSKDFDLKIRRFKWNGNLRVKGLQSEVKWLPIWWLMPLEPFITNENKFILIDFWYSHTKRQIVLSHPLQLPTQTHTEHC